MTSLGGSFAALPMMTQPASIQPVSTALAPTMAPVAPLPTSSPIAPMFQPAAIVPQPVYQPPPSTIVPQPVYQPPPIVPRPIYQPPLYTDPAGNTCSPTAVDASGYCPTLSTGTQQPYTDPNGVTCYPDQLDGYGYCPGSLEPIGDGSSSPPPPLLPPAPSSSGGGYATNQVPAPGSLVPVSTASPYAWSQLSTKAKIAVVLLGLGVVGGGYYMIKRRRRAAA